MAEESRITAFDNIRAIESLRASDFDLHSSVGELIDNGIQAKAKKIVLKIKDRNIGKKRPLEVIDKVICGDDGEGMDEKILQKSIRMGYSSRYNDRTGIGRFGVGMTLAAIRFATKIEIYSKIKKNKDWFYVSFDLKNKEDIEKGISSALKKELPKEFENYVGRKQGTLVIWSNFDKCGEIDVRKSHHQDGFPPEETLDSYGKLNHWIGRTYRKYLRKDVKIKLNDKKVYLFDPLYIEKKNSQFLKDPTGIQKLNETIDWKGSKVRVKVTILPEKFRGKSSEGGLKFKGRYIDENQGVSILRKDREVFFGLIPYFGWAWDHNMDRWWGCEISFDPTIDECFSVKHIKRGAIPEPELKEALYDLLKNIRKRIFEETRAHWTRNQLKKEETSERSIHDKVEELAEKYKTPRTLPGGKDISPEEIKKKEDLMSEGLDDSQLALAKSKYKSQPYTVAEGVWKGDMFIDIGYRDGKTALLYNSHHNFVKLKKEILEQIKNESDPKRLARLAEKLMEIHDILLLSFSKAGQAFEDDEEYTARDLIDELTHTWGRYLKSYIEHYKKEEEN